MLRGYFKSFYFYAWIQFSMLFKSMGFTWIHDRMKGFVSIKQIEKVVSTILGAKVLAIKTSYSGAAMDIDCEEDYFVLKNFKIDKL
jgi:hypothetical protein